MYYPKAFSIASAIRGFCRWCLSLTWNSLQPSTLPSVPWDKLPDEIVRDIVLRMSIHDCKSMSCVCREWDRVINRSKMTLKMMQSAVDSQIPWLLQENELSSNVINLYTLPEGKRYEIVKPKCMWGSFCCGTSKGWLIMLDMSKFYPFMFLWNPITDAIVPLPSLGTIPWYRDNLNAGLFDPMAVKNFVKRVEVFYLSNGGRDILVVVAILGLHRRYNVGLNQTLVLCTPEEEEGAEWTMFDIHTNFGTYSDVLFHDGLLYVVKGHEDYGVYDADAYYRGNVEIHRINLVNLEVTLALIHVLLIPGPDLIEDDEVMRFCRGHNVTGCLPGCNDEGWLYLAESIHGELLLIRRTSVYFGFFRRREVVQIIHNETRRFHVDVFKFEFSKGLFNLDWSIYFKSLALKNQTLFIGTHGASAYKSEIYKNLIWYLPSNLHICHSLRSNDNGVFDFRKKKFKRCFPSIKVSSQSMLGWFTPKLL